MKRIIVLAVLMSGCSMGALDPKVTKVIEDQGKVIMMITDYIKKGQDAGMLPKPADFPKAEATPESNK